MLAAVAMFSCTAIAIETNCWIETEAMPIDTPLPMRIEIRADKPVAQDVEVIGILEDEKAKPYTERDVEALSKMLYGEARGVPSDMEKAAVVWCVINRFTSGDPYYRNCHSLYDIVVQPSQFFGYSQSNPVTEHLEWLVRDVLDRWSKELDGEESVGRTLPKEYLFFHGSGGRNHFTKEYQGSEKWDWSGDNPYES